MPQTALSGPYLPRADGRFRDWLENFAAVVSADPAALGLSRADAKNVLAAARRYGVAYGRATAPATRSPPAVAGKNAARRRAWDLVRPMAMRVKRSAAVSRRKKVELGIYAPNTSQSPIRPPKSYPQLEVVAIGKHVHRLRYRDSRFPSRLAKPYGAVAMELHVMVGRRPARSPESARRVELVTRHVFDVPFKPADARKTATYFARWLTRRGKTGPWSRPLALMIP